LPVEISDAFTAAGVVHLLALSGLHVSLLAALLDFLLRRTPLPAGGAFGIVLCALGMYAMMVGAPASILRAVIMYAIVGIGRLRQRPRDTLTSLAAAFLALTLFSPTRVLDAGLLLSFASIFGMLCLTPSVEWFRFPMLPEKAAAACGYLCQTFLASLGATLATLPIVAILYEKVHLYGLLANMILVPMASAALPLAFLSVLLGAVHVWLGIPFAALAEWILKAVIWLAKQVERWPGAALYVRGWNGWLIPGFYAAVFLSSPYMHSPHKSGVFRGVLLASAMGIAAAALGIPAMTASPLTICFLDAGQADSAVVRMEDRVYVVDAGMDDVCAAYLKDRGLQVDGLFLTHPHDDHAGGAEMVLYTHCGTLYVPDNWHRMQADGELQQIPTLAQELGWEVCYLAAGDGVDLGGGAQIRVLWPEEGLRETNANKGSMVLWLQYGEGDALFLADKTAGLEFPLPGAELVKVAHHGGVDGTDEITAQAVSPVLAVIPVGANSYGHPNEKTIALWEECGAKVLRTDRDGNVLVDLYEDGSMQYQVHPD